MSLEFSTRTKRYIHILWHIAIFVCGLFTVGHILMFNQFILVFRSYIPKSKLTKGHKKIPIKITRHSNVSLSAASREFRCSKSINKNYSICEKWSCVPCILEQFVEHIQLLIYHVYYTLSAAQIMSKFKPTDTVKTVFGILVFVKLLCTHYKITFILFKQYSNNYDVFRLEIPLVSGELSAVPNQQKLVKDLHNWYLKRKTQNMSGINHLKNSPCYSQQCK